METMNLKKNTWSYYSKFMAVSVALLLCTIMVFAQQKDVKGTVLDTKNMMSDYLEGEQLLENGGEQENE